MFWGCCTLIFQGRSSGLAKEKNQQGVYPSSLNKYSCFLSDLDRRICRRVVLHFLNNQIMKQDALLRARNQTWWSDGIWQFLEHYQCFISIQSPPNSQIRISPSLRYLCQQNLHCMQYLWHPSGIPHDLSHTGICTCPGTCHIPWQVME